MVNKFKSTSHGYPNKKQDIKTPPECGKCFLPAKVLRFSAFDSK